MMWKQCNAAPYMQQHSLLISLLMKFCINPEVGVNVAANTELLM